MVALVSAIAVILGWSVTVLFGYDWQSNFIKKTRVIEQDPFPTDRLAISDPGG